MLQSSKNSLGEVGLSSPGEELEESDLEVKVQVSRLGLLLYFASDSASGLQVDSHV